MVNLHQEFPKTTTWSDLSRRLVKMYRLPHGSYFALRSSSGRLVRSDKRFARKRLVKEDHLPTDDDVTVKQVCDRVAGMLAVNLRQLGWSVEAYGPSSTEPLGPKMHLRRWREMAPALTPAQREARALRRMEIDEEIKPQARAALHELEEGLEDPETKVPHAMIAELVEYYGEGALMEALSELRLVR